MTQNKVVALVADYSDYAADIAAEMKRFDRAAVPLVVVIPARADAAPMILPDPNPLLGPGHYADLVIAALRQACKVMNPRKLEATDPSLESGAVARKSVAERSGNVALRYWIWAGGVA